LIEREDYGIVLFWIENSDIMQHMIWKSPELLLEYYSMIDKKIEGIKNKHRFDNLFVFSDHGFEGCPKYNFFIHTWLEREGYLRFKGGSIGRSVISRIYPQVKKRVPNKVVAILKKRFKKKKAEKGESIYQLIPGVEWERTVAYAMGWGINIIRNNIKDGDYNSVRDEIIDKLKKLRWNGLPVMREVKTRESEYTGPYTNKLPDILFVSGEDFATTNYPNSEIVGEDITVVNKDYEGEHGAARNGILIASGSDIARCKEIEGAELIDLVPTLLHMVGVPIPEDLDGKVLKEIFREDSEIAKREVVYQKIDERERIRGRVRKLKLK